MDNSTGKLLGIYTEGNPGIAKDFSLWIKPLEHPVVTAVSNRRHWLQRSSGISAGGAPWLSDLEQAAVMVATFLYNTAMCDSMPGFRCSWGEEINSEGQVVGYLSGAREYLNHYAFLDSNGFMVDLNNLVDRSLQTTLSDAAGINDLGQIVANGSNGHAYLLTPVPESGTLTGKARCLKYRHFLC